MKRGALLALALSATPGCSGIVASANFSVNATVGAPSSAGFDNVVISGLLIGAVAVDVALIVLAASEVDMAMNERQLETDLARGVGPFISDLAHALGLPESDVPRLGAKLRQHREALIGAMQSEGNTSTATRLLALRAAFERALIEDPELKARLDAARFPR